MSAEQVLTYIDSSAIVKLVVAEPESKALRRYLVRRQPLVSSALARTEVARALMPSGPEIVGRGEDALRRIQLLRVNDRVLAQAGRMEPPELRSLDAIHLASARAAGGGSQADRDLRRTHGACRQGARLVCGVADLIAGMLPPATGQAAALTGVAASDHSPQTTFDGRTW